MIRNGKIAEVTLKGNQITGKYRQTQSQKQKEKKSASGGKNSIFQIFQKNEARPENFNTIKPALEDPEPLRLLEKNDVIINAETQKRSW
jgi:hypothetical protein